MGWVLPPYENLHLTEPLETNDFISGNLRQSINIRPNRLFTADCQIILSKVGQLKSEKFDEVIAKIVEILQQ